MRNHENTKKNIIFLLVTTLSFSAYSANKDTMSLDQFIDKVQTKNKNFQMSQTLKEAASDKKLAGDISLVPILILKGAYLSDKKQPVFTGGTETITKNYSLGVAKKFSSGTQLKIFSDLYESTGKDISSPSFAAIYGQYSSGALGISMSQSLWKDAFGRGTRIRQKKDEEIFKLETAVAELQMRQTMADSESAFWDLVYSQEEQKIREASLQRAKRIENWVTRRSRDGIGDRADLMNARALMATRQMQLLIFQDEYLATQQKIKDVLEMSGTENLPVFSAPLEKLRPIKSNTKTQSKMMRLDLYIGILEARAKNMGLLEAEDNLRSDLLLSASYNTNSYEPQGTIADAPKNMTKANTPTAAVSLSWTYLFDTDVKDAAFNQIKKEAYAAQLKSEQKMLESESSWTEFQRRHAELSKKIDAAKQIAEFQMERAKAEQDKLSKGRSITSQVISSEQDAADAELNLSKLRIEQRKLESQSRLFVGVDENL